MNGRISGVRISRVIAGDCRDGATWRWDRRAITVRNGCRADFEVAQGAAGWGNGGGNGGDWGNGGGRPARVTCQSWNFQSANCAAPGSRNARLVRVLGGNCVQGRTWGISPGMIWVDGGCRAVFELN